MLNDNEKLKSLTRLGIELNQIHDLDILMEHILSRARDFVGANAGSIYIKEGNELEFSYTQNDTLQSRMPPGRKLIYSIFTIPINETSMAGYVAETGQHLNVPDVYAMKDSLPYKFNKIFDVASDYRTKSVLTMPLKNAREKVIGILQIINAQDDMGRIRAFTKTDEDIMLHFASIAVVALERAQMTRAILLRMIRMAELRDPKETGAHVNRVAGYSVEIYERWARKNGVSSDEIDRNRDSLRMAAMLHDVGKVAISDLILKKPGRFEPEEFEIMKTHTVHGARLFGVGGSDYEDAARLVAFSHHERWDGKGYPGHVDIMTGQPMEGHILENGQARGKKGDEIPFFGRIVALADVYDALCSARVYKDAWKESDVLDLIEKESGAQFDPEVVEIFFEAQDVIKSIQERYANATNDEF
ncbi:MAG: HD domain-containing protein [Proteobacteria bacterium]|nr:HD domain-containing protein [Pseudomonadota bacterium]